MNTEPGTTWRDRAGRIVLDPEGPHGEPLPTPTDRRWLWRIENELSVGATSDTQRQLAADLYRYLCETCEHHWHDYEASEWRHPDTGEVMDRIPAHRQCLWCSEVDWAEEVT